MSKKIRNKPIQGFEFHGDEITGTFLMYDKIENKEKRRISFFKNKTIQCSESYLYVKRIDMQELQAINKKVKELGWKDE